MCWGPCCRSRKHWPPGLAKVSLQTWVGAHAGGPVLCVLTSAEVGSGAGSALLLLDPGVLVAARCRLDVCRVHSSNSTHPPATAFSGGVRSLQGVPSLWPVQAEGVQGPWSPWTASSSGHAMRWQASPISVVDMEACSPHPDQALGPLADLPSLAGLRGAAPCPMPSDMSLAHCRQRLQLLCFCPAQDDPNCLLQTIALLHSRLLLLAGNRFESSCWQA